MAELANNNPHWIYVDKGDGNLVGVGPGQIINASGDFEQNLRNTPNVGEPTDEQREKRDAAQQAGERPTQLKDETLTAPMLEASRLGNTAVSAPLQEVIGDDDAPYGPPTGTITTKQAVAQEGPVEKERFADHERLPDDLGENASPVEREQAAAKQRAEEVLQEAQAAEPDEERKPQGGRGDPLVPQRSAPSDVTTTPTAAEQEQTSRRRKREQQQQPTTPPAEG